jgi:mono/diheme cytochrome c family protein
MKQTLLTATFLWLSLSVQAADTHVVVPGYERFRAEHLKPADAGRLLVSELNCQSCHGKLATEIVPPRQAPILTNIAQRANAEYIRQFIADPQLHKPGTAMPQLAALKSDPATIDAITAFLSQGSAWRATAVGVDAVRRGEELFHQVGCAACHADQRSDDVIDQLRRGISVGQAKEEDEEDAEPKAENKWTRPGFAMPLGKLDQKYSLSSLINFLREPHTVRPSGRMPSLNLTPEEARDIASYLLKDVDVEANIHFEYFEGDWQKA